jgi:DNA-binding SARP family transcriptional activator
MQVRLLGPVDVVVHGEPRPVHGLRRKTVLAVLALYGGEIVSTDYLADAVWGDAAPPTAVNSLHTHVSYLRGVLGSKTAILARPPGYVLQLPGDGTDVQLAERLLEQGTQSADPAGAVRHLRDALALWRGRPLAGVAGVAWVSVQAERLDLLGMRVRQALSQARLAAGEHAQLVPELEQLVAGCPLDERVHGQLMLALYRSGRQADALAVYRRMRHTLREELGIDPSPVLRELEAAILRQDPALEAPARGVAAAPAVPVPAQLPPAVAAFTGRGAELASLDAVAPWAAQPAAVAPQAVVLSAVSGTAGVGKTALAVHWAHRVAAQFPDGQLYVNLRGFDPGGAALDPGRALHGFLDAFGVPATRIPEGLAARSALFRSVLALQAIGHSHAVLGNYEEAITYCERSLSMMRQVEAPRGESAVWDTLGYIHHHHGDFRQAIACYERALVLTRDGDRFNEADTLNSLGDVHLSAGDPAAARKAWNRALRIFDEIDHSDRDQVRAKLRVHDHPTALPGRSFVAAAPSA